MKKYPHPEHAARSGRSGRVVEGRNDGNATNYAVSSNNSRPISIRRISDVPAPIS
jgi:hypothetical protein